VRNAWEDLQDFLAMLALPDGGRDTERFLAHEAAWAQVRAAYMSNVNRQVQALAKGGMAAEVEASRAAAKPYVDAKCREPQVKTIFEWLMYKSGHLVRKLTDTESIEDKLDALQSVEVQLFGNMYTYNVYILHTHNIYIYIYIYIYHPLTLLTTLPTLLTLLTYST